MTMRLLILLSILPFAEGNPRLTCSTPSIEAVEGDDVTLRYQLDPPRNLSTRTVDVKIFNHVVHAYRYGKDYLDPQLDQYRNRTTLSHADLIRGILTLQISSVNLSDSGPYKGFVPEWRAGSVCNLTVVKKDQQTRTKRGDSSTSRPPVEEVTDHVKKDQQNSTEGGGSAQDHLSVVGGVLGAAAVVVAAAVLFILERRGVIRICKKKLRGMNGQEAERTPNNHEMETLNAERDEDPHSAADHVLTEVVIGDDHPE